MGLLLKHGNVITQNDNRDIINGDILIEEGNIINIASEIEPKGHDVYNFENLVIAPGFVQSHIHLCQTLFRNIADNLPLMEWLNNYILPLEAAHTKKSLQSAVQLGLAELLLGGTTCILDMGHSRYQEIIFQEMVYSGIRGASGMVMMDIGKSGSENKTDRVLVQTEELIGNWHKKENHRISYALAPRFIPSCSSKLLKGVKSLAEKYDLIIHSHASENQQEVALVKSQTGVSPVHYFVNTGLSEFTLSLAHCVWLTREEIDLLSKYNINVLHCPSANLKLGSGIAPIPEYLSKNINVSLGSDGAACNNNLDMFQEMRLSALIQKPFRGPDSLPAQKVFDMATLGGARSLNLSHQIGSLEVGKKADLVVFNFNKVHSIPADDIYSQIVYSGKSENIRHVMIDGIWQVYNQKLQKYEENEVIKKSWYYIYKMLDNLKISLT
jgi:cytosine/adenosine deaminase-related metal-dependent hydrolase